MKKIFTILLGIALIFSTSIVSFANESQEITFEELMDLASKYNFEPVIVDEPLPENKVISGLTKEELENLIIKTIEKHSKPLHFEEIYEVSLPAELDKSINSITPLSTWIKATGVKILSRTNAHGGISEFILKKSVAASYEYEYQNLPGEPNPTRNWRFTGVADGGVVHLNPGEYQIKTVSSNSSFSDTVIFQQFSGIVNVGFYVSVGGFSVRIPLTDNPFSGSVTYSISEVQ